MGHKSLILSFETLGFANNSAYTRCHGSRISIQTSSETSSVSVINAYRAAVWGSRHNPHYKFGELSRPYV
jgi:hypothetical protein